MSAPDTTVRAAGRAAADTAWAACERGRAASWEEAAAEAWSPAALDSGDADGFHSAAAERWDELRARKADTVACECGDWSGEACEWSGPRSETVVVEYMPEFIRASHEAAGNSGTYPENGASRIRVERSCADRMLEHDGDWCAIVEVAS